MSSNDLPKYKVVLVGGSGVGKTCIVSSFVKKQFDNNNTPTIAPALANVTMRRKDGVTVVLEIWDTAGQERFQSVSQIFYRDADVALVCMEASDSNYDETRKWIERVIEESPACHICIVLTKADLLSVEDGTQSLHSLENEFQTDNIDGCFITSAKENQGIQQVFDACADFYMPIFKVKASSPLKVEIKPSTEPEKKKCC